MLRGRSSPQQRPVSPANTTFSGISSYRSDSYRAKDAKPPNVPPIDPKVIAKVHYEELTSFLVNHLTKENQGSRMTAREKLTKLTMQQFQELSTDVYDELVRRNNNSTRNEVPFLPVREEFHPKRNQARQKLATLPTPRFKDLSSDVYYELGRRFPEFKTEIPPPTPGSPTSAYEGDSDININPLPPPQASPPPFPPSGSGSHPSRQPSQDLNLSRSGNESREPMRMRGRPSIDSSGNNTLSYGSNGSISIAAVRKPSRSERDWDRDLGRDIAVPTSVKPGMVIPNKSTMAEEDPIEVPFGTNSTEDGSVSMAMSMPGSPPMSQPMSPPMNTAGLHRRGMSIREREREKEKEREREEFVERENDLDSESEFARSPSMAGESGPAQASPSGPVTVGLSGLGRLGSGAFMEESDNSPVMIGTGAGSGLARNGSVGPGGSNNREEDYSLYGRSSAASDRSGGAALSRSGSKLSRSVERDKDREKEWEANREEMRRDYEFKLATLQKKCTGSDERVKMLEEELEMLKERTEDLGGTIRSLQRDLEEARAARSNDQKYHENEISNWKVRYNQLEEEHAQTRAREDPEISAELRREFDGLLVELQDLQSRYDQLFTAKERTDEALHRAEEESKDWKRRYENAKMELRSYKTTSSYFLPQLQSSASGGGGADELSRIRYNPDGGVLDIQLTEFQSSIDNLLTIGRSPTPAKVLTAMRTVVDTVTAILENPRPQFDGDSSAEALNERLQDTLSNLVIASRNHAQSYGLSPVSLLDAAASHVSETVLELARYVGVRRGDGPSTGRRDDDDFRGGGGGPGGAGPTSIPSQARMSSKVWPPSAPDAVRKQRIPPTPASASFRNDREFHTHSGSASVPAAKAPQQAFGHQRNPPSTSDPSSSAGSSSSPIFDTPMTNSSVGGVEIGLGAEEVGEDAWSELKPYLEAQCESLVYAIQSVLASVRATNPAPSLDEHLTQIITIVSSIVAVCKDSVPLEGRVILQELSEHCDRLSEVQASMGGSGNLAPSKETRQTVAKSSFAVANAVKSLMKL